jgi:hypothetical protein
MKETLIRYRKDKARETLDDARMLLRDGTPSSALNRIYYAMFYEVLALLHTATSASINNGQFAAGVYVRSALDPERDAEAQRFVTVFEDAGATVMLN